MTMFSKLLVAIVPVLLIVGCATKGPVTSAGEDAGAVPSSAAAAAPTSTPQSGQQAVSAVTAAVSAEQGFAGDPLDDPSSLLAKRVIYFDFDRSEIKDEFRDIIAAHSSYLAANPNVSVVLEGHADERGTREYNMGLGERRANVVSRYMGLQGVAARQLETVSYGEERPVADGHDEGSWRLNRRVEIIYQGR